MVKETDTHRKRKEAEAAVKDALELAKRAHAGQFDRSGKPYIDHPIAVAGFVDSPEEKILALLHDTVEDTEITLEQVRQRFGGRIGNALALLTRDKTEPYMDYIRKIAEDPLARAVKLADLRHNMDLSRLPEITPKDRERQAKYEKAREFLQRAGKAEVS